MTAINEANTSNIGKTSLFIQMDLITNLNLKLYQNYEHKAFIPPVIH
jgi:hypothetical protein